MTQSEVDKLHKSIATDFKIVVRKTELWTIPYCHGVLHDIKKLMVFRYIDRVFLIMNDLQNSPVRVKKYNITHTPQSRNDRPGGIDWEEGEGQSLTIVLGYTPEYLNLTDDQRIAFQTDNLRTLWGPADVDVNFPHLFQSVAKIYTHSSASIDRVDFN